MSIAQAKGLDAKEAISLAHTYFQQLFTDSTITDVLLEELDFDEYSSSWKVTLSFDVGRRRVREPAMGSSLGLFGDKEFEPIREARLFSISDSDGALLSVKGA